MTIRTTMLSYLSIAAFALASVGTMTDSASAKIVEGKDYGPTRVFRGVYFTNFENTVFTECAGETLCRDWASKDGAWVNCVHDACADLERRIKALNGSHDKWGTFAITFVGRHAIAKHAKRFLNDREDAVLIGRIIDLRLFNARSSSG